MPAAGPCHAVSVPLPLQCKHAEVARSDCVAEYSVEQLPAPLDSSRACAALKATAYILPVCVRAGSAGSFHALFSGPRSDDNRALRPVFEGTFLSQRCASSDTPLRRRRIIAFDANEPPRPPATSRANWLADGKALLQALKHFSYNSGNLVWLEGSRRLVDGDGTILRGARTLLAISRGRAKVAHDSSCCHPSALLLPAANLLSVHSRDHAPSIDGARRSLTGAFTELTTALGVPSMLVGIGVQVLRGAAARLHGATTAPPPAGWLRMPSDRRLSLRHVLRRLAGGLLRECARR